MIFGDLVVKFAREKEERHIWICKGRRLRELSLRSSLSGCSKTDVVCVWVEKKIKIISLFSLFLLLFMWSLSFKQPRDQRLFNYFDHPHHRLLRKNGEIDCPVCGQNSGSSVGYICSARIMWEPSARGEKPLSSSTPNYPEATSIWQTVCLHGL